MSRLSCSAVRRRHDLLTVSGTIDLACHCCMVLSRESNGPRVNSRNRGRYDSRNQSWGRCSFVVDATVESEERLLCERIQCEQTNRNVLVIVL
jgi:hypothetical protein